MATESKVLLVSWMIFSLTVTLVTGQTLTGTEDEILIWNGPGPGSDTLTITQTVTERTPSGDCIIDRAIEHVTETGIIPFIAEEPNGTAVIICPGGAYSRVVVDKEGTDIAEWFNSFGISAFVVKYRLPVDDHINKQYVPLQDAQRAMRYVRNNAGNWEIDPDRIGIMGASAGGHMAATLATKYDAGVYTPVDSIDSISAKPNFMILIYPVVSMEAGVTHDGTRTNLLGTDPSAELIEEFSADKHVTSESPITFMARALDDGSVSVENCNLLSNALTDAGVANEFWQYVNGGHGKGICAAVGTEFANWVNECGIWLHLNALTDSAFKGTDTDIFKLSESVSIHPNPVNNPDNLIFSVPDSENLVIRLYDLSGRILEEKKQGHVPAGNYSFSFVSSGYKEGFVIAEMNTGSQRISRLIQILGPDSR